MLDDLDAKILHALQLAPRVSFRRIAEVVESSEQTVARRYHRLRRGGAVRVVGVENRSAAGEASWVCRIRAAPDRISQLASGLVRRADVTHANFLVGLNDLVCVIRAPLGESREDVLLHLLPRSALVTDVAIELLLHSYGGSPGSGPWTGYGSTLDHGQAAAILVGQHQQSYDADPYLPTAEDRPIFEALAEDGRTPHSELATRTGWSIARVSRRVSALQAGGALLYDVDLLPERLGFHLTAVLWLTVSPKDLHRVGERVAAHDHIAFAGAVSGTRNIMAVAICRGTDDLYGYLSGQLGQLEGVRSFEVDVRTQRLKQHGSLVVHGRLMNPRPGRATD